MSRIKVALNKLKCTNQEEKRVRFTLLGMTCISRLTSSENFPRSMKRLISCYFAKISWHRLKRSHSRREL